MRCAIVSEHLLCRGVLEDVLRDDLHLGEVVATANLGGLSAQSWDLMVFDPPSSVDPVAWLADAPPARRRVLLIEKPTPSASALVQRGKLDAVLWKTLSRSEIAHKLDELIQASACRRRPSPDQASARQAHLTPRQHQVAQELRKGRTNKQIANQLGISVATVKLHVQAILQAAGARNRTEAVSRLMARSDQLEAPVRAKTPSGQIPARAPIVSRRA